MAPVRPHSAAPGQETPEITPRDGLSKLDINATKKGSNQRPSTAGLNSSRSNASKVSSSSPRRQANNPNQQSSHHRDDEAMYFDSFKKDELRELIAESTASWLLSPDFRGQTGLPIGLVSNLYLSQHPSLTVLVPVENNTFPLEYREVHQIIRELTTGIFAVNQTPRILLEPNFDLSTSCQIPMAYKDTRTGQVLQNVDYAMKSFWHGVHVPKGKRQKLTERWRTMLGINTVTGDFSNENQKSPINEFTAAGQENVTEDELVDDIYDELKCLDPSSLAANRENQFFNSYSEYIRCMMTLHVERVRCSSSENVIACESSYEITPSILLADDDMITPSSRQRLQRRLRHHVKIIEKGLRASLSGSKNLALLKIINIVALILVSLRKRLMRIPDLEKFLIELSVELRRTEPELPPFAIGKEGNHPNEIFTVDGRGKRIQMTHMHGGIQFDFDTGDIQAFSDHVWSKNVREFATQHMAEIKEKVPKQEYVIPTTFLDDKEYYVIHIPLTTYYPATPPLPAWLHARYQRMSTLRPRKLPMNDLQIAEHFKKIFGFRRALANKNTETGLNMCACRGLVAPFIALMRKAPSSSLMSPNLQGMTLLHDCCIYNQPAILSLLLSQNPKLNTRRSDIKDKSSDYSQYKTDDRMICELEKAGGTPLQYAARTGSLECVTAMLASKANPMLSDSHGRSTIHHAAEADQVPVVRAVLRRHPNLLEIPAAGHDNATPLLAAASNGSLKSLQFLVKCGADVTRRDATGDGAVHRAVLNFHTDVLRFFVETSDERLKNCETLQVWKILVDMLSSNSVVRQDASLRCLEVLLHQNPSYWSPLYEAGVVIPLVKLLGSSARRPKSTSIKPTDADLPEASPVRSVACSVVCLMSEHHQIRRSVAEAGAIPILISMLQPGADGEDDDVMSDERCDLHSRSSVVLADLAHVAGNAELIAEHGGIGPLVGLLQSNVVDVLVNVVATLSALCRGDDNVDANIQNLIMECGAAWPLFEFLSVRDDSLQAATSDAIGAICKHNSANQNKFVLIGALTPLVEILRGHCISAQMKAALAVECIAECNEHAQAQAKREGAPDALCRLFQIWSDSVKERGASALWSIAGQHPEQQREIAKRIGSKQIIEMLISKSKVLQFLGCQAVAAWSRNSRTGQEFLTSEGAVGPLIRLLRLDRTTREVVLATIQAISAMCIGVAHANCRKSQVMMVDEGVLELLVDRVWRTSHDQRMQVELLHCLACVVTGCSANEDRLNELDNFGYEIVLEMINSPEEDVKFRAIASLALFAFNRIPQQQRISRYGGLDIDVFDSLLMSRDRVVQAGAAFQLVVLARVVVNTTVVDATAKGIIVLVTLLDCEDDVVAVFTSASYLASLAHTRAGIPDAIITSCAVDKLLRHLKSSDDRVRENSAQALGYLSFNRTASRHIMSACRGEEGLYELLVGNLGEDGKISDEFVAEFKRQLTVGLPIPKTPPSRRQ